MGRTLAQKVWDDHVVRKGQDGEPDLLFIDLHLVHEVTSPQAFDGLRMAGRPVRRLDLTIATEDHNTPTADIQRPLSMLEDKTSAKQLQTLRENCASSACGCTRSATPSRASSTSSARSWDSPSRG